MGAINKAALEKRLIVVLMAVLLLSLMAGPIKQWGLWRIPSHHLLPRMPAPAEAQKTLPVLANFQDAEEKQASLAAGQGDAHATNLATTPAYTAHELRDPLQSLLPSEPQAPSTPMVVSKPAPPPPPQLRLQGILWGGPRPTAIINDKVYTIGDHVQGATVTAIDHREVTLDFQGTPVSLRTAKNR